MARPQCDTPLDGLGFSWCLLMLVHCFLWVHPWASKEEENKREKGKTKHTQKLQQVGTNSTSSMVSSVHSEMAGWGFFLSFFLKKFLRFNLDCSQETRDKTLTTTAFFFFPFFFWCFFVLCANKPEHLKNHSSHHRYLFFGLLVADR